MEGAIEGMACDCCAHLESFDGSSDFVQVCSDVKSAKLRSCAELWIKTRKEPELSVARKFMEESLGGGNYSHHQKCYQRFTNTTRIAKAQKRKVR